MNVQSQCLKRENVNLGKKGRNNACKRVNSDLEPVTLHKAKYCNVNADLSCAVQAALWYRLLLHLVNYVIQILSQQ